MCAIEDAEWNQEELISEESADLKEEEEADEGYAFYLNAPCGLQNGERRDLAYEQNLFGAITAQQLY